MKNIIRSGLGSIIVGSILSTILLLHCASTIENEDTIVVSISGYVKQKVDTDTVGIARIKVSLIKTGLSDSTENNGFFSITATQSMVAEMGFDLDTLRDSAIVEKDGRPVFMMEITRWIDTLPTVYLEQRDIRGKLDTSAYNPEENDSLRITVIIKNGSTETADSAIIEAWYFRETNGYSCYAYFQNTRELLNREYVVYSRVFDSSSHLIGQSRTVRFTDKAGDIEIPVFNPYNAIPEVFAGADTTVSINDSIPFHGTAVDSFGGTITSYAWDIGNTGDFQESSGSTFSAKAPAFEDSSFRCILRVTDDDGNSAFDTLSVSVIDASAFRLIGFAAVRLKDSADACIVPIRLSPLDSQLIFDFQSSFGRGVARLDAASDSTLWYCDTAGGLWEYTGGSFRRNDITITSATLKTYDVGVNYRGDVFAAGEGNSANYYKYNGGLWTASQGLLARIDVANFDSLGCHIGAGGDIYKEYLNAGWVGVGPLKAVEVSVGAMMYAVGKDSAVYRYMNDTWAVLSIGTGIKAALVETNMKDEALVIDALNQVHYKDPLDQWRTTPLPEEIESMIDITIF